MGNLAIRDRESRVYRIQPSRVKSRAEVNSNRRQRLAQKQYFCTSVLNPLQEK